MHLFFNIHCLDAKEGKEDGARRDCEENEANGAEGRSGSLHRHQDAKTSVRGKTRRRKNGQAVTCASLLPYYCCIAFYISIKLTQKEYLFLFIIKYFNDRTNRMCKNYFARITVCYY